MTKRLLACAAALLLASGPAALAQSGAGAAKPVSKSDYLKNVDTRFNAIDANHDGVLTSAELGAEQQREMQQAKNNVSQTLQNRFKQLDTNHDGQLSLQEFLAIAPPMRANQTPEQMMQQLDTNHDGKVSAEEWRAPQLVKFSRVDADHDGIVTPEEIKAAAGRK